MNIDEVVQWANMASQERDAHLEGKTKELAEAVAPLMGAGWSVVNSWAGNPDFGPHWRLTGPAGEMIDLDISRMTREKLTISGAVPNRHTGPGYMHGEGAGIEIQVSWSRGAAVIAKEIQRRFMPDYLLKLAKAIEQRQANADYAAKVAANLETLRQAFGVETRNERDRESQVFNAGHGIMKNLSGDCTVQVDGGSCTLHFRGISVALAVEIAATVRAFKGAK